MSRPCLVLKFPADAKDLRTLVNQVVADLRLYGAMGIARGLWRPGDGTEMPMICGRFASAEHAIQAAALLIGGWGDVVTVDAFDLDAPEASGAAVVRLEGNAEALAACETRYPGLLLARGDQMQQHHRMN